MCYHILGEIDGFRVGLIFRHQTNAIDEDIGGLLQHSLHLFGWRRRVNKAQLVGGQEGDELLGELDGTARLGPQCRKLVADQLAGSQ